MKSTMSNENETNGFNPFDPLRNICALCIKLLHRLNYEVAELKTIRKWHENIFNLSDIAEVMSIILRCHFHQFYFLKHKHVRRI